MFFHSYNDEIKVTFSSISNNHKGFKLEYSTPNCDRNYTSEQGRIYHKGFTNCWITITVPANRTISLYFNHFNIYDSEQCTRNALQVRYLHLHLLKKSRLREQRNYSIYFWKPEWCKTHFDTRRCKSKFSNRFTCLIDTRGRLKWTAYNNTMQRSDTKPDFQYRQQTHFALLDRELQLLSKLWHHLHDHGCR